MAAVAIGQAACRLALLWRAVRLRLAGTMLQLGVMDQIPIRIVAALVMREGQLLLVRKQGTAAFMQPGGKIDPGEDALACLRRELAEELGCGFDEAGARRIGLFQAPAANEPGRTVEADLYEVSLIGAPGPRAEIAELAWIDPRDAGGAVLAPLTRDHVLPLAVARLETA